MFFYSGDSGGCCFFCDSIAHKQVNLYHLAWPDACISITRAWTHHSETEPEPEPETVSKTVKVRHHNHFVSMFLVLVLVLVLVLAIAIVIVIVIDEL